MATLIANFGGPRDLSEIAEFLTELLTDRDVIRSKLPKPLHYALFRRVARKRAASIVEDYKLIGGRSPIYEDTEAMAKLIGGSTLAFHRYLPATHRHFLQQFRERATDEVDVFPCFPQFTHATTGSMARWMKKRLSKTELSRLRWVASYATHPSFVSAYVANIRDFLSANHLAETDVFLLFSAHGIPEEFLKCGDPYQDECHASFQAVMAAFPETKGLLSFQSKFGRGEWIKPYTADVCRDIKKWASGRPHVVIVPISFTSDHIETLFEIEYQYLPPIREQALSAYRCPALNLRDDWIEAIRTILKTTPRVTTEELIRA